MATHAMSPPPMPYESERPVEREKRKRRSDARPQSAAGMLWFAGWLFTIGFAKLVWWKALLALVVWPYFLGTLLR